MGLRIAQIQYSSQEMRPKYQLQQADALASEGGWHAIVAGLKKNPSLTEKQGTFRHLPWLIKILTTISTLKCY